MEYAGIFVASPSLLVRPLRLYVAYPDSLEMYYGTHYPA
jgi:hypothetical protein